MSWRSVIYWLEAEHAMSTEDALSKAQENYKKFLNRTRVTLPLISALVICEHRAFYDQAIEYYQQGLNINPTNVFAHFRMGKIHFAHGHVKWL